MNPNVRKMLELTVVGLTVIACILAAWLYFGKPNGGLVAHWAFEGNGQDSAGHNDLTTGGAGVMTYAEGKVGQAMSQTGNSHAFQLPGIAGLDFNQDFTLSVWLYREPSIYDNDAVFDDGSFYVAKRDAAPWNSRMGVYLTASDKRFVRARRQFPHGPTAAAYVVPRAGLSSWEHGRHQGEQCRHRDGGRSQPALSKRTRDLCRTTTIRLSLAGASGRALPLEPGADRR